MVFYSVIVAAFASFAFGAVHEPCQTMDGGCRGLMRRKR